MSNTVALGWTIASRLTSDRTRRLSALASVVFLLLSLQPLCCCLGVETAPVTQWPLGTDARPPREPIYPLPPTADAPLYREKPVAALSTDIRPPIGQLPADLRTAHLPSPETYPHGPCTARNWSRSLYRWEAACLQHHPLYFEDINLERHGHRVPYIQPVLSAAHFFGRIPALPYLATLDPPYRHEYVLGHGRPGTYEPCPIRRIPVEIGPSLVQGAAVTGLIFALP